MGLAIWLTGSAVCAAADPSQSNGLGAGTFLSTDSEGFNTRRFALEYFPRYRSADSLSGLRYTSHTYNQNNWSRSGQQLSLVHREINPATAYGWNVDVGMFQQGGHSLLTLETNYRRALAERTGVELFATRDWVETPIALDNGIHFTFLGAAIEQGIGSRVTLLGLAGRQIFSDDNVRNHRRFKVVYQPDLDSGLTLQMRYRAYTSAGGTVGGAYFNPVRYEEIMPALGWRRKIQDWTCNLTAGGGRQKITTDPYSPTYLFEAGLQSPPGTPYSMRVRAGVTRSAAFLSADYRYSYLQGEWIVSF
ncbi:MAG: hypothetical protein V4443_07220 [Pseudomonadota bacterium]